MIKDLKKLTSRLIATCLDASKISYTVDKDGDFRIVPPQKSFILYISIKSSSVLRFMTIYPNPIPPRKCAAALMVCNTFHQKTNYGRAYVHKTDDNDYYAIFELYLNFENGMLSEFYFLNDIWSTVTSHGMEFITNVNKYCDD